MSEPKVYLPAGWSGWNSGWDWQQECRYIERCMKVLGELPAFNHSTDCFVWYCEMQRDSAEREGFHDTAQYIQHCIDDLTR